MMDVLFVELGHAHSALQVAAEHVQHAPGMEREGRRSSLRDGLTALPRRDRALLTSMALLSSDRVAPSASGASCGVSALLCNTGNQCWSRSFGSASAPVGRSV